jgi:hypothetical protein
MLEVIFLTTTVLFLYGFRFVSRLHVLRDAFEGF